MRTPSRRATPRGLPAAARLASGLLAAGLVVGPIGLAAAHAAVSPSKIAVKGTPTNTFDPKDFTVTPDAQGKVTITFTAEGAPHTLQSDEVPNLNSQIVNAGETKTLVFSPQPGVYAYYCSLHQSIGMTGTLTVTDKTGKAPSASPSASASASGSESAPPESEELARLEAEKASNKGKIGGFFALLIGASAALTVGLIVMFFATRPRRSGS